jgi:hypothetical protein
MGLRSTPHNRALRIISVYDAGPEHPLGCVVGRLNIAELKQAVEPALECARVRFDRGVGEVRPAATDLAGALQQRLEWRGEHGIAGIYGVTSASRTRWARQTVDKMTSS